MNIIISHPDISARAKTALTEAATISDMSLLVDNGLNFANNDFLLLNGYNNTVSEIVQINGTPTATTITLDAAVDTQFAHEIGRASCRERV